MTFPSEIDSENISCSLVVTAKADVCNVFHDLN